MWFCLYEEPSIFCLFQGSSKMPVFKSWHPLLCLDRGVSISVLRHEAEFYGITPLGKSPLSCAWDLTLGALNLPEWKAQIWLFIVTACCQSQLNLNIFLVFPYSFLTRALLFCLRVFLTSLLWNVFSKKASLVWRIGALFLRQCPVSWLPASTR